MVNLTCLNSVSQWKHEQITKYPEIIAFIEKLEKVIKEKPEKGLSDPMLSVNGKEIPCYKQSINIALFSHRHAIGFGYITASYVYNNTDALIVKMKFS